MVLERIGEYVVGAIAHYSGGLVLSNSIRLLSTSVLPAVFQLWTPGDRGTKWDDRAGYNAVYICVGYEGEFHQHCHGCRAREVEYVASVVGGLMWFYGADSYDSVLGGARKGWGVERAEGKASAWQRAYVLLQWICGTGLFGVFEFGQPSIFQVVGSLK